MGKKLIIKGADFSENCIGNILAIDCNSYISDASSKMSIGSTAPYADGRYEQLQGKTLSQIEFKAATAGTISILKAQSLDSGGAEVIGTINISQNDVGKITRYPLNVMVGPTDIICIGASGDTGSFYYSKSATGQSILATVGQSGYATYLSWCLCVNWYVYVEV